jgi:hypothetical protein
MALIVNAIELSTDRASTAFLSRYSPLVRQKSKFPDEPESGRIKNSAFNGERVKGIEPSCPAWEAGVLPLNYTRMGKNFGF